MHFASLISGFSLLAYAHAHVLDTRHVGKQHRDSHPGRRSVHAPSNSVDADFSVPTPIASLDFSVDVSIDATGDASYWLADIAHQGIAAFNSNPSDYTVFRNVKDYGAKGNVYKYSSNMNAIAHIVIFLNKKATV
jgi:glucan 1,3-beta-glucosidase